MAIMSKEYYADIESVYKKPEDYELAGKGNAYIRIDAEAKVTGTAVYTDDVYLPGMYYCKLVHSPYAHALMSRSSRCSIRFTPCSPTLRQYIIPEQATFLYSPP